MSHCILLITFICFLIAFFKIKILGINLSTIGLFPVDFLPFDDLCTSLIIIVVCIIGNIFPSY